MIDGLLLLILNHSNSAKILILKTSALKTLLAWGKPMNNKSVPATILDYTPSGKNVTRYLSVAGLLCFLAAVFFGNDSRPAFSQSSLFAFILIYDLILGSFALTLIHNLVGGDWGNAIKPLFEI